MTWNGTQVATDTITHTEWNSMVTAINGGLAFTFVHPTTVGTSEVTIAQFEFPVAVTVLRGYAYAQTAPGSGYNCTIKITDGTTDKTFDIAGTANLGSDEAIDQNYDADTTMTISVQDDNASAATDTINIVFWYKPQ